MSFLDIKKLSLAAHLLEPPFWGRRLPRHQHPTTSPLTPAACAESADKGLTALVTAVSKPDSVVLINPVTGDQTADDQEGTVSTHAAPPSRRRRRPYHRQTTTHLTPVALEESADSGPAEQGAAESYSAIVVILLALNRKLRTVSSPLTGNAKPAFMSGEREVLANLSTVGFSESVGLETVSGPCSY